MESTSVTPGVVQICLVLLVIGCIAVVWKQRRSSVSLVSSPESGGAAQQFLKEGEFNKFQRSYLVVYLLCTFSDWLKGPYVYALYEEYGFTKPQIAWLFVGGFLSSLVFGTFVGSLSDKFGRRRLCMVFCGIYAASAFTKLVNSFAVLLFGRVLSGIATSLLFTSFESWMVSEHKARQFPEHLLSNTFSKAILGNGAVAIAAGLVAQTMANSFGYVAPFLTAVPCLGLAAALMIRWNENYGNQSIQVRETLVRGWEAIMRERKLQYLGLCQSLFEGCMYVWVFYWTPAIRVLDTDVIPFGLVFACFMAALMIGGMLTDLIPVDKLVTGMHCACIITTAAAALFFDNKLIVFGMFTIFEGLVGIYFAGHGTLRSVHMEESTRSSVMNIFRVPLNAFVIALLQVSMTPRHALLLLTVVHMLSLGCLVLFFRSVRSSGGATASRGVKSQQPSSSEGGMLVAISSNDSFPSNSGKQSRD
jgi:MFS transporter, MFS domain-containing protein family, molybdate-anion transporter